MRSTERVLLYRVPGGSWTVGDAAAAGRAEALEGDVLEIVILGSRERAIRTLVLGAVGFLGATLALFGLVVAAWIMIQVWGRV